MASRFATHIRLWFFFVPLLAVTVGPAIPEDRLFVIDPLETDSVMATLGSDGANAVMEQANSRFHAWFIDTDIVGKMVNGVRSPDKFASDAGVVAFAELWVRHFWLLIFRVIYRLGVLQNWAGGLAVFTFAMFVDGSVRRKIKASAAGFASPLSFHVAWHGLFMLAGATLLVLFLPLPLIATFISVGVLIGGGLARKAAESFRSTGS
jgi:hypothetical protein